MQEQNLNSSDIKSLMETWTNNVILDSFIRVHD